MRGRFSLLEAVGRLFLENFTKLKTSIWDESKNGASRRCARDTFEEEQKTLSCVKTDSPTLPGAESVVL